MCDKPCDARGISCHATTTSVFGDGSDGDAEGLLGLLGLARDPTDPLALEVQRFAFRPKLPRSRSMLPGIPGCPGSPGGPRGRPNLGTAPGRIRQYMPPTDGPFGRVDPTCQGRLSNEALYLPNLSTRIRTDAVPDAPWPSPTRSAAHPHRPLSANLVSAKLFTSGAVLRDVPSDGITVMWA